MVHSGTPADPPAAPSPVLHAWPAAAALAIAAPTLLAYNVPPSPTFLNQALAYLGWGVFGLLLAAAAAGQPARGRARADSGLAAVAAAVALLAAAALAAPLWASLPWTLALSAAGTLAGAAIVLALGAAVARRGLAVPAFHACAVALYAAAVLGAAIAVVQVFVPGWSDGRLIAAASDTGRAAGNLRQANHLSSLLLWGLIASVWLHGRARIGRWPAALLGAAIVGGIVLTASRTGVVGLLLLALWGLLDRRLARSSRAGLLLAPLVYMAIYGALAAWRQTHGDALGSSGQLVRPGSDFSSSRLAIWSNTLALIARHPWTGVGWGEFNLAWTLTPFPDRPGEFFDHAHSLALHLGAELGAPLALAVLALFAWALWRAFVSAHAAGAAGDDALRLALRSAFMVVLMMALHSQVEYPLWYAYFLLPTAFAWGLCLGRGAPAGAPAAEAPLRPAAARPARARLIWVGPGLLALGGAAALHDYTRVVPIFAAGQGAAPLAERIAEGRRSVLFGHHADYAAMTSESAPREVIAASRRAAHYLLDSRLMEAWAKALAATGSEPRARYLAARLREFRGDDYFFVPCDEAGGGDEEADPPGAVEAVQAAQRASAAGDVPAAKGRQAGGDAAPPFQCLPPPPGIGFEAFR